MNEREALRKMKAPGDRRRGKWLEGVIQILVTHSCDKACFGCTQGSQLSAPRWEMTPEQFRNAVMSLEGYYGVVGVFGGNPALSSHFTAYCEIMRELVPFDRRGVWCNNPIKLSNAQEMARTFNPKYSNLNVHMDRRAYEMFKHGWPECSPVGLFDDSQHSPPWVSMKDIGVPEGERWERISRCDINQHWSAGVGVFRGSLRAWFCEEAMAQAIRHQHNPSYPDTGLDPTVIFEHETGPGERLEKTVGRWWQLGMQEFAGQVSHHCHDCGVPMRGRGELAVSNKRGKEQVSKFHLPMFNPKDRSREIEFVVSPDQLGEPLRLMTNYIGNAKG